MNALLWLLPIAVLIVGGFFLFRAFARVSAAMREVREGMAELGEMGPRLQRLAGDMSQLSDSIQEKRRQ
jgi:cytochrome c-type biogenesis protein CcmH/NrfF